MGELDFGTWLDRFYRAVGPEAERDPEIQALLKADDRYDYGSTDYYNPIYSATVSLEALTRSTSIYRLLPKTTYMEEGDSLKYISADASYLESFLGEEGTLFAADTAIPTITEMDNIWPAVYSLMWEDTRVGREMAKFQNAPKTDIKFLIDFFNTFYANAIDMQLAGTYYNATDFGVDQPASKGSGGGGGSWKATIECIDRMISNATESGASNYVSVATDGDIFWSEKNRTGTDTPKIDRSAVTWANAQVKLPTTAGTEQAYNILDELDDLMATALVYAPTAERNYIGLCSPKALNKVQDELDPKQRFLEFPMDVYQTISGVSTRPGRIAGKTSVAALAINGVKVPMFTSPHLMGRSSNGWVWENSVFGTGGVGNIYLINMDSIEIRHLIPISYVETPNYGDWILGNRHVIFSAMTLVCRNFASHAALKYIAA